MRKTIDGFRVPTGMLPFWSAEDHTLLLALKEMEQRYDFKEDADLDPDFKRAYDYAVFYLTRRGISPDIAKSEQ